MCAEPNEPKPPHTFPETHACARASQRAASGSASSRRAAGHRDARANSSPLSARAVACRWSDRRDTPRGVARIGLWHLPTGAASRRRRARATARAVGGALARRQLAGAAAEAAAAAWQAGGGSCERRLETPLPSRGESRAPPREGLRSARRAPRVRRGQSREETCACARPSGSRHGGELPSYRTRRRRPPTCTTSRPNVRATRARHRSDSSTSFTGRRA